MGVPGFFISLFKKFKHKNFVINLKDHNISQFHELYLDTNCLIHPICMKVCNEYPELVVTNLSRLEDKMIKEVINYINELICHINPLSLIYIAIDGVAPMAKIKHQRLRRFKSIKDAELKESIARKHNHKYNKPWNNSAITPGTIFMKKLTSAILFHLQNKIPNDIKIKYIFSSCNTAAEGEHKILQYIKQQDDNTINRVIYGLDADLIYLALASGKNNIYLLRECMQMDNKTTGGFNLVSIDIMKDCIFEEFNLDINKEHLIRDYIFLGFLLGNDFLPPLPSVNLQNLKDTLNGLNILNMHYCNIYNEIKEPLILDNIVINNKFFIKLFKCLSDCEEGYFREVYSQKPYVKYNNTSDPYESEIYKIENLLFKIDNPIQLGKTGLAISDSKIKYYNYYNIDYYIAEGINKGSNDAINEYINGLYWVAHYYFDKCPDWLWFYKHEAAPFVSDIYDYIKNNEIKDKYPLTNDNYKYIKPLQQLLMVLPVQSGYILPSSYRKLLDKELKDLYPKNYEIDLVMKKKYWQGVPKIPMIDPIFIKNLIKDIKLTSDEELRNKHRLPFEILI